MIELFKQYECKGFYKKAHDGVCVYLNKNALSAWVEHDGKQEEVEDYAEKTYYEYVTQNFKGVVVGFTDLVTEGYLDVIYDDAIDVGCGTIPEKFYVKKRPKTTVRCAIVYYSNNKKHYVPITDIRGDNNG